MDEDDDVRGGCGACDVMRMNKRRHLAKLVPVKSFKVRKVPGPMDSYVTFIIMDHPSCSTLITCTFQPICAWCCCCC